MQLVQVDAAAVIHVEAPKNGAERLVIKPHRADPKSCGGAVRV